MALNHIRTVKKVYKTILRLNRGLPIELRMLGDEYARSEFKRHKNCNAEEAKIFIDEWTCYAVTIAKQLGLRGPNMANKIGMQLNYEDLENFRSEQIQQLYDLKVATMENKSVDKDK